VSVRYFLEVVEYGECIPAGRNGGYATLAEAKEAALKRVDDALPHNTVRVLAEVAVAGLGGDGVPYVEDCK
jgi:hypothetical protein